jgi:hypothetical protein
MNLRVKAGTLAIFGAIAAMSAARVEAQGGGPIIFREEIDDSFTTGACGFPMEVRTTGTGVFHLFLDETGSFERLIITEPQVRITFTNLETGESVWTPSVNMVMQVLNEDGTGTKTLRGLLWRLVVPGDGLLTADVGRIDFLFTFDDEGNIISEEIVFSAGQQENNFLPMVCSALAS